MELVVTKWEDFLLSNQSCVSQETQSLTKALQSSLSNNIIQSPSVSATTSAAATSNDLLLRRRRGNYKEAPGPQKMGKWKSRAGKKKSRMLTTTYMEVDPENFRAMVQWMTGPPPPPPPSHVVKPEPRKKPIFFMDQRVAGIDEVENEFDVDSFFNFPTLESYPCGI